VLLDVETFKSQLWSNLYEAKTGFRRLAEPLLQAEGLNMIQAYILFRLSEGSIASIGSLSRDTGINQGNLSSMCKIMEHGGLLARTRSKEDERVVTLTITEEGRKKLDRLKNRKNNLDQVLTQYPPEKLQKIIEGLRELNELIRKITTKGR